MTQKTVSDETQLGTILLFWARIFQTICRINGFVGSVNDADAVWERNLVDALFRRQNFENLFVEKMFGRFLW